MFYAIAFRLVFLIMCISLDAKVSTMGLLHFITTPVDISEFILCDLVQYAVDNKVNINKATSNICRMMG